LNYLEIILLNLLIAFLAAKTVCEHSMPEAVLSEARYMRYNRREPELSYWDGEGCTDLRTTN